jgi:hypothetical protein
MSKQSQASKERDAKLPKQSSSNTVQPADSIVSDANNDDRNADLWGSVAVFALVQYM